MKLSLLVGSRPGPLENVNLEDYHSAKESGENKNMLIPKHNTSRAGPASLGMDRELQGQMDIYIKNRFKKAEKGQDKFSVKADGSAFEKNTIGRRFCLFWEKKSRPHRQKHKSNIGQKVCDNYDQDTCSRRRK